MERTVYKKSFVGHGNRHFSIKNKFRKRCLPVFEPSSKNVSFYILKFLLLHELVDNHFFAVS